MSEEQKTEAPKLTERQQYFFGGLISAGAFIGMIDTDSGRHLVFRIRRKGMSRLMRGLWRVYGDGSTRKAIDTIGELSLRDEAAYRLLDDLKDAIPLRKDEIVALLEEYRKERPAPDYKTNQSEKE